MSGSIIRAENLSKRYTITVGRQRHDTLRDQIADGVKQLLGRNGHGRGSKETFWALKDVSFEVKPGEVIGLVGQNGAGKSTLLKILSRITTPTHGMVDIHGRVGSLLEVGTGFHQELSGRENIYLNGAILGMKKCEIDRKFDEIVAFSEVEKFIDTPVKRYSSGMYMRLAFAVAAHLEPEILVIDEVLAVGDINFQKKCLGKMGDVAKQGRTVLFVSHNMAAIQSLCSRGIMLDAGRITCAGTVQDVVKKYFQTGETLESVPLKQRVDRSGDGSARIISIRIENINGGKIIHSSSRLKITLRYESTKPLQHPRFLISVKDATSTGIFLLNSEGDDRLADVLPAHGRVVCVTDPIHLTPGRCSVDVGLIKGIGVVADDVRSAMFLDVEADDVFGAHAPSRSDALCLIKQQWTLADGDPVLG